MSPSFVDVDGLRLITFGAEFLNDSQSENK